MTYNVTVRHAEVLFWNNYTLNPFTLGIAANVDTYLFTVNARCSGTESLT
jgi:hypothetical protein